MAFRVLRSGFALLHLPDARVIHYGVRDWRSGSALTRRTYMAVAAAYTKYIRLGDPVGLFLVAQQIGQAVTNILGNLAGGRRPIGVGRLYSLFVGVRRSFELSVDPGYAVFRVKTRGRRQTAAKARK
jgi:hypothetical protein